jgi:hypothetical protein
MVRWCVVTKTWSKAGTAGGEARLHAAVFLRVEVPLG